MATVQIDVIYTRYSGSLWGRDTTTVYPIVVEANRLHEVISESIPDLVMQLEDETGRFAASEITLTARNDDGWWNPGGSGAFNYPDPYMIYGSDAFKKPHTVKIYKDSLLRWEGDIDLSTVTYDRKQQTVTFTAVSALTRLAHYTAETVRRSFPTYLDTGASTATGTGTLTDSSKAWTTNRYVGHVLVDALGQIWTIIANTATVLTVTSPWPTGATVPSAGTYCIHPFGFTSRDDFGTSSAVGANSLTDSTRTWTVNQWAGFYCEDSAGAFWPIASNTGTVLTLTAGGATPAAGAYSITYASGRRILRSRGPTVVQLGLRAGDKLLITGALQSFSRDDGAGSYGYWHNRGTWEAQEVEIEFAPEDGGTASAVGALTITDSGKAWTTNAWANYYAVYISGGVYVSSLIVSNTSTQLTLTGGSGAPAALTPYTIVRYQYPALLQNEVWLKDELDAHMLPRDCTIITTPYYRGQTLETLVRLLFTQAQITSPKVLIPSSMAALTIPYADFEGKSVADALGEFAAVTGCALFCQTAGTETYFYFRDRSQGVGSRKDVTGYICERQDRLLWDRFYDGVVARGAQERVVLVGSQRYGGNQLEIGSDYINTYGWLRELANRVWGFHGLQRQASEVAVLGEYTGQQLYSFENDPYGLFPPGWTVRSGVSAAWVIDEPYALASRVLLGGTLSGSVHSAISCDAIGSTTDIDMRVDLYMDQQTYRYGIFVRRSLSSAYAVYLIPYSAGSQIAICSTTWASDTSLAASSAKPVLQKTMYTLRVQVQGAVIRARFWAAAGIEPTSWDVSYSGATIFSGHAGLVADKQAGAKAYFDNFTWVGGQWNLYDAVTLDGSDSWIVTGIKEPLDHDVDTVQLALISASGTTYTPPDSQIADADSLPEPPTITSVTSGGGAVRLINVTWNYGTEKVAGFLYTPWTQQGPRPEEGVTFAQAGNAATYLGSGVWQIMASTVLWGASPWMVDVAVVLADGRISLPSDPMAFT